MSDAEQRAICLEMADALTMGLGMPDSLLSETPINRGHEGTKVGATNMTVSRKSPSRESTG